MSQVPPTPEIEEEDADDGEPQVVHHISQAKKRKKGVGGEQMELQLTSMIDVIFQLLIYFIITANFVVDEGVIKATLPGDAAPTPPTNEIPPVPTNIRITTSDDGINYQLYVDSTQVDNISELYGVLYSRMQSGRMKVDTPVNIHANKTVRWQHVMNVYNACVRADLEKVGFVVPGAGG